MGGLQATARELQTSSGVELRTAVVSITRGTSFDSEVRRALAQPAERAGLGTHEVVCFAGHDAGSSRSAGRQAWSWSATQAG